MFRTTALAGLVLLAASSAQAQGWYSADLPPGPLDTQQANSKPAFNSYNGFYTGPSGEVLSGTVNSWSLNLGSGVSMSMFTSMSNGPGYGFANMRGNGYGLANMQGNGFITGFPGTMATNYASGLNVNPMLANPVSAGGQMAFNLGHGLSMNFIGGISNGQGMFYSPFNNQFSSTLGTGFTMNFGHGGSLSFIGSFSRGSGCSAFTMTACR